MNKTVASASLHADTIALDRLIQDPIFTSNPTLTHFFTTPFEGTLSPIKTLYETLLLILPDPHHIPLTIAPHFFKCLQRIVTHCARQHKDDSPEYVSHDFRHSLRVKDNKNNIFDTRPDIKAELDKEFPEKISQFLWQISALLHDIGYPLQQQEGLQKSTHTFKGALIFYQSIQPILLPLIETLYPNTSLAEKCCTIIRECIHLHGSDKKEDQYSVKAINPVGILYTEPAYQQEVKDHFDRLQIPISFETQSEKIDIRYIDLNEKNDCKLGIPFLKIHFTEHPALWALRAADNADSHEHRLTCHQQKEAIQKYQHLRDHPKTLHPNSYNLALLSIQEIRIIRPIPLEYSIILNTKYPHIHHFKFLHASGIQPLTHLYWFRIQEACDANLDEKNQPITITLEEPEIKKKHTEKPHHATK